MLLFISIEMDEESRFCVKELDNGG